jgi:hypothetical protein
MGASWSPYEEYHLPDDLSLLIQAQARHRRRGSPSPERTAGSSTLLAELALKFSPCHNRCIPANAELLSWIEGTEDLAALRVLWRKLGRIVVFDARCNAGDWLLGAADSLECLYQASIGRMRAFLGDSANAPNVRRPEHLSDFRETVGAVAEHERLRAGQSYVRQLIAQRHLFGFASSAREEQRLRRRVLRWAGFPAGSATLVDANIRRRPAENHKSVKAGGIGRHALPPTAPGWPPESLAEEIEIVGWAWGLVAKARLEGDGPVKECRRAAAQLEERRRALEKRWAREFSSTPISGRQPPAHISFPILHGQSRSIVVARSGVVDE